jgi:transketolase N-terminal domain/subunit
VESAADVMAVLLARHFRYDWQRPDNPANDHLIFSKGHELRVNVLRIRLGLLNRRLGKLHSNPVVRRVDHN